MYLIFQLEVKQEKQECSSELRFGGQMCIKAYIHGKATVREASQVSYPPPLPKTALF